MSDAQEWIARLLLDENFDADTQPSDTREEWARSRADAILTFLERRGFVLVSTMATKFALADAGVMEYPTAEEIESEDTARNIGGDDPNWTAGAFWKSAFRQAVEALRVVVVGGCLPNDPVALLLLDALENPPLP